MQRVRQILLSTAPASVVLIRFIVGGVFLSEGIQKFLYPALRGPGRFEKIGFPAPDFFGYFVGTFEVVCGVMLLLGLLTRLAAIPMIINMAVAIIVTKIPIILGEGFGPFNVRELSSYGFWSFAHEARTDFAMLMGSIFLLIVGGGRWSFDAILVRKLKNNK